MANLLQAVIPDPRTIARMKALQSFFGEQAAQQPQISDENPTAPTPQTPSSQSASPAPNQPSAQPGQPANLAMPGAISSAFAGRQQPQTSAAPTRPQTSTPGSPIAATMATSGKPVAPTLSGAASQPSAPKPAQNPLATPGGISKAIAANNGPTSEPAADYATRFRRWEQSEPVAPKPEDFKTSLLRKLYGAAAGFGIGALAGEPIGAEVGERVANPGLARAQRDYARAQDQWKTQGAGLEKEAKLRDLDERINASEAAARRAIDGRTLDQLYTDAVRAGDGPRQAQVLDAIKGLEGAKRGEETPFAVWRQQNPTAPVESFFAAEKGGKEFADPFQAFLYGTPDQQKAAKDFIAFERQQGARFERPDEIQERYSLYKRDPEAYRDMFGNRGTAQDQAQASRMLKFFDTEKNRITNDFTLGDDDKKQQLQEIADLEQPYLAAASVQPPSAQGAPSPARNGNANQNANANGNVGGPRKDEVEVTNPQGVRGYIPKANLARALKQGYKQVNAQ